MWVTDRQPNILASSTVLRKPLIVINTPVGNRKLPAAPSGTIQREGKRLVAAEDSMEDRKLRNNTTDLFRVQLVAKVIISSSLGSELMQKTTVERMMTSQ